MVTRQELIVYLNGLLEPEKFHDYCPNGLQVQGKDQIKKIVTGVTACQALLEKAVAENADAVLVHHGYFWKDENPCITGIKRQRLGTLINNNINLIAYHLPLDAHLIYGNNVQLARVLDFKIDERKKEGGEQNLVFTGKLKNKMTPENFISYLALQLDREPLHIPGNAKQISTIAWCSGGAQDFFEQILDHNVDAYLTGEISEKVVHLARETGIHFFSCGHHATERFGIQVLGEHLHKKFGIQHQFIDIANPV